MDTCGGGRGGRLFFFFFLTERGQRVSLEPSNCCDIICDQLIIRNQIDLLLPIQLCPFVYNTVGTAPLDSHTFDSNVNCFPCQDIKVVLMTIPSFRWHPSFIISVCNHD